MKDKIINNILLFVFTVQYKVKTFTRGFFGWLRNKSWTQTERDIHDMKIYDEGYKAGQNDIWKEFDKIDERREALKNSINSGG